MHFSDSLHYKTLLIKYHTPLQVLSSQVRAHLHIVHQMAMEAHQPFIPQSGRKIGKPKGRRGTFEFVFKLNC